MTDERKNDIWAMLDIQCQNIAKDFYLRGNVKVAWAIEQFFGKHNLIAQAEEKPKEPNYIADTSKKIDYAQYRFDLAKEIAVAVIRSDRWDFHSCNPVEQANEIVKRLKETEE